MDKGRYCEEGVGNMERPSHAPTHDYHWNVTNFLPSAWPAAHKSHVSEFNTDCSSHWIPREIEYKGLYSTTAHPRGLLHHIESIIGQSVSTDYLRTSAILRLEVCFMKAETNR